MKNIELKKNSFVKTLLIFSVAASMVILMVSVIPSILADQVTAPGGTPGGTNKYFLQAGSSWKGNLEMDGSYTWEIIVTSLDGSGVTGNKVYQTFVQESIGWNNFPIQIHHDFYGAGGHLLQSFDRYWTAQSSHGFNPGAVIGPFDLKYVFSQNVDDSWHVAPYYRVPSSSVGIPGDPTVGTPDAWNLFFGGAWDTTDTFDFIQGLVGVENEAGGGGTLLFNPPLVHCIETDIWYIAPPVDAATGTTQPSTSFQHAIAYVDNGDTIVAYVGTYIEQVYISKPLTIMGMSSSKPVIQAPPVGSRTTYTIPETSRTFDPIVMADGGGSTMTVSFSNFEIDGLDDGGSNTFTGILFREITGDITGCDLHSLQGIGQETMGIIMYGANSDMTVEDNTVTGFSRNGITGIAGTHAILGNTVTGDGPLPMGNWAQNGIQVAYDASGEISGNTVSGCSILHPDWAASGILPIATVSMEINDNTLIENEVNVYLVDCSASLDSNDIYATGAGTGQTYFYGIVGDPGDPEIIPDYSAFEDGIHYKPGLDTYTILVTGNTIVSDGSSGGVGVGVYAGMYGTYDIELTATENDVFDWDVGFELYEYAPNQLLTADINYNNIVGNNYGVYNWLTTVYNAECNWWGSINGPTHPFNTYNIGFQGDSVSDYIDFCPWLDAAYPAGVCDWGPVKNLDTGETFCKIQAAIDDSDTMDGHTISVAAGTYQENAHAWVDIHIYKSVTIIGAGSSQTIVELRNGVMDGVSISTTDVTLEGMKFTRQPGEPHASGFNIRAGINVITPPPGNVFYNIRLIDIESEYSYSSNVVFDGSYTYENVELTDCNIHHSYTERCLYESPNTIMKNVVVTNSDFDYAGYGGAGVWGDPRGFDLQGVTEDLTITGGTFNHDPGAGISLSSYGTSAGITNAVIEDVTVVDSGYLDSGRAGITIFDDASNVHLINPTVTDCGGRGILFFADNCWGPTSTYAITDCSIEGGTITGSGNIGVMIIPAGDGALISNILIDEVTIDSSGSDGILVYEYDDIGGCGDATCSEVIVTHCIITGSLGTGVNFYGVDVAGSHVNYNNIVGNAGGVSNAGGTGILDALCNWWNAIDGPSGVGPGSGDSVSDDVKYCPWLDGAYPGGNCNGGCDIICDAGGPYSTNANMNFEVEFDGNCAIVTCCGDAVDVSYYWDFGDGYTSTEQNPVHTYDVDCPPEGGTFVFYVTYTVTSVLYPDVTCSSTTKVEVYCTNTDPPIVQIIYPVGGETLSGTVTVQWFALDDHDPYLDIYLYYGTGGVWRLLAGPIGNTGEYEWDTTIVSDGSYQLKVEAVNTDNLMNSDTSGMFTVDNGFAGVRVSDVRVTDTTINSYLWVKDGDIVEVTAGITGGQHLSRDEITADVSGLGGDVRVGAESFDGFTARWLLTDITCTPSDGTITVTVTASGDTNSATISADNTLPALTILKPDNGLYVFNTKFLPLGRAIILGGVTVELDAVDASGIWKAEFYVDDELTATIDETPFTWFMNQRLIGRHTLIVVVYDHAGNTQSATRDILIFNLFGA